MLKRLQPPQPPHRPRRLRLPENLLGDLREPVEIELESTPVDHVGVGTSGEAEGMRRRQSRRG